VTRFVEDTFLVDYEPTISNTYRKTTRIDGKPFSLDILDTAGMEDSHAVTPQVYKNRDCFLLVYSVTERRSFDIVQQLYADVARILDGGRVPCVLCGNKTDLTERRQVSIKEGRDLAKKYDAAFIEASALNGSNVEQMVELIVAEYLKQNGRKTKGQKTAGKNRCTLT
jgi:small GTP-binding protein